MRPLAVVALVAAVCAMLPYLLRGKAHRRLPTADEFLQLFIHLLATGATVCALVPPVVCVAPQIEATTDVVLGLVIALGIIITYSVRNIVVAWKSNSQNTEDIIRSFSERNDHTNRLLEKMINELKSSE